MGPQEASSELLYLSGSLVVHKNGSEMENMRRGLRSAIHTVEEDLSKGKQHPFR